MTELRSLDLWGTGITDEGLEHLGGLKNLQGLCVSDTLVTDHGLLRLKGLTRLKILQADRTHITPLGVAELQCALPRCRIGRFVAPDPMRDFKDSRDTFWLDNLDGDWGPAW